MKIIYGLDAGAKKRGETKTIEFDSQSAVNGHVLLIGMSGAGKTYNLRKMIKQTIDSSTNKPRVHVFDVHGDIDIEGASEVFFSEQTDYGINPLQVSDDVHAGGVRKQVQRFISTMNKVMRSLGSKQEAALRNIIYDCYQRFGFDVENPETWKIAEHEKSGFVNTHADRLYIDVPFHEKNQASELGARWDKEAVSWWIEQKNYVGAVAKWPPKLFTRRYPTIDDVMRYAKYILQMNFFGTGSEAIINLEIANKASSSYQQKLLQSLKYANSSNDNEKLQAQLEAAKLKAIESYSNYANAITTGNELEAALKYSSTDVLKSVLDRLENLQAIGIFKNKSIPFDDSNPVWRYNIKSLSMEERKLFVLFRLEEIFTYAVQRGEQTDIKDVIVLDEGHIYTDDDPDNIINTIAKEARKFGVALICASQSPTHFTDDFVSSVATKVILGIDEMYWQGSIRKMRVTEESLSWIRPHKTMLVQLKNKAESKNAWRWTLINGYDEQQTQQQAS